MVPRIPGDEDEEQPGDERALFREAMRDVRPLRDSGRAPATRRRTRSGARARRPARERPSPAAHDGAQRQPPRTDLYELQPGDELLFRRSGVSEQLLRRLRRGQIRVDAEIDLHGCTLAQALPQLHAFLRQARARALHCVRIIHGKGLRSGNRGPVLKNSVNAQLRDEPGVLAFASARPAAGGTGATLVLLARA